MKRTYQPHRIKRVKKHGFLHRMKTSHGQKIIKRRMAKKRNKISISSSK